MEDNDEFEELYKSTLQGKMDELAEAWKELANTILKQFKKIVEIIWKTFARYSGKAGQIYLRTKSKRIKKKQKKIMLKLKKGWWFDEEEDRLS